MTHHDFEHVDYQLQRFRIKLAQKYFSGLHPSCGDLILMCTRQGPLGPTASKVISIPPNAKGMEVLHQRLESAPTRAPCRLSLVSNAEEIRGKRGSNVRYAIYQSQGKDL
jgi:hypothetical protein